MSNNAQTKESRVVKVDHVQEAFRTIEKLLPKTPLKLSASLSRKAHNPLYLKFENLQKTGSFKVRGSYYKLSSLKSHGGENFVNDVIACSAGNHAQGFAWSATQLSLSSKVVMPISTPVVKVESTQTYGAEVVLKGENFMDSLEYALNIAEREDLSFVHPYDDPHIVAGQGTIALEILKQLPQVTSVLVPIGGGGLISGAALTIKALKPQCRVYGVGSEFSPGAYNLFHGKNKSFEYQKTISESTAVKEVSHFNYENYIKPFVDDIVYVTEKDLLEAMFLLLERTKTLVEGAGALSVTAAVCGGLDLGDCPCAILSGGNVNLSLLSSIIEKSHYNINRLVKLSVVGLDQPGVLKELLQILSQSHSNVVKVDHHRSDHRLNPKEVLVDIYLEVSNDKQIQVIEKNISEKGYRLL